jgi:alpha-1,3-glucosyltransferase
MVGDRVSIDHEGSRRHGIVSQIQDTSRLHAIFTNQNSDDQFRSYTFQITLEDSGEQLTRYKASELQRDRRVYSKLVLKQFLRSAVSREPWYGAPWSVKEHLARKYQISTTVPEAKTKESVMAAKKAANAASANGTPSANTPNLPNGSTTSASTANGHGPHVSVPPHPGQGQTAFVNYSAEAHPAFRPEQGRPPVPPFQVPPRMHQHMYSVPGPGHPSQFQHTMHPPPVIHNLPPHLAQMAQNMPPAGSGLPINLPFQNNFMQYQALAPTALQQQPPPPPPKPFEPVKYPIEDLNIKQPKVNVQRPPLKFFSDDVPEGAQPPEKKTGILMKSIGPLLCTWETLNVHDSIYSLDSFTIDDFVDAMRFSSEEVECELLTEVHCAVLKQIVDDSGKLQAPLPKIEDSDDSEEEDTSKQTTPEPEPEPPKRTTRSSLRKSEANALSKQRTPTPEPPKQIHKAAEFLAEYDWIEQCAIRNFREGGWQAMLVGVLHRLSFHPVHKDACDEVLAALVPPDEEPSVETIAEQLCSFRCQFAYLCARNGAAADHRNGNFP